MAVGEYRMRGIWLPTPRQESIKFRHHLPRVQNRLFQSRICPFFLSFHSAIPLQWICEHLLWSHRYPSYPLSRLQNGVYSGHAFLFLSRVSPKKISRIPHPASILSPIPHSTKPMLDSHCFECLFASLAALLCLLEVTCTCNCIWF